LSNASPEFLSFACPKCQKKLRAPAGLAGQKLACPKCSASIRVPGIIAAQNEDDEWLKLDGVDESAMPNVEPSTAATSQTQSTQKAPSEPVKPPLQSLKPTTPSPTQSPTNKMVGRSVFDDDLPELMPPEPQLANTPPPAETTPQSKSNAKSSSSKSTQLKSKVSSLDLSDIQLEALGIDKPSTKKAVDEKALNSGTKSKPSLTKSLEEISLASPALGDDFAIPKDDEFRFACKICGTLLYANQSRIGTKTRCPDCYSEFNVPKPIVKKKAPEIKLDESVSVKFSPIDSKNSRDSYSPNGNAQEILEKAAVESDREREELEEVNFAFDTKRWIGLIFGFLQDPLVIVAAVVLGLVTSVWLFSIEAVGSQFKLEVATAFVVRAAIFAVFFLPISGAICLCGIAILTMAANRAPKVNDWPFTRLGESIGDCAMVLAAVLIASIPGGMLGGITTALGANPVIAFGLALASTWGLAPILLLSMINNSSVFEPYSKAVVDSIKNYGDAWGAMYIQSGLAYAILFSFSAVASLKGAGGDAALGLVLPIIAFFIFNQMGVLAGRISSATEMGFDGDFSAD